MKKIFSLLVFSLIILSLGGFLKSSAALKFEEALPKKIIIEEDLKQVFIKQDSLNPSPTSEHHIVITGITEYTAPASIFLITSDGVTHTVYLSKVTGDTAHYDLMLETPMILIDGYAWIFESWNGQFNESWTPTAVTLINFKTIAGVKKITVTWETITEINNCGFNIYRNTVQDGVYTKMNKEMIPTLCPPGSMCGGVYNWEDLSVVTGKLYYYILEDVECTGLSQYHGPITGKAMSISSRI